MVAMETLEWLATIRYGKIEIWLVQNINSLRISLCCVFHVEFIYNFYFFSYDNPLYECTTAVHHALDELQTLSEINT